MKFFETSRYFSLKKSTYVTLRWIAAIGQLISIYLVYFLLGFKFNFILANCGIFLGILSNLYLIFVYKKSQLSERSAFIFLIIDILQLAFLVYLTGGVSNPFVIFLIIPSIFSSSNLGFKANLLLVLTTSIIIILLTFYYRPLPFPLDQHYHIDSYIYFSIPVALIIALTFLNYFALSFNKESRIRKEALNRMEEVMAKEHELLSLGGQAAAAAHSLGTPLSTIKIITQELLKQFEDKEEIRKDIELLSSQVSRCNEILKKLTLDPIEEDEFIDKDLSIREYLQEIVNSFKEISNKKFFLNFENDTNPKRITKSIEIVYGLRNFIGNANKYSNNAVYLNLKSNNEITEITIEDDGYGYPRDIMSKIGEPYLKSAKTSEKSKSGLGLGIFIGKTLLEKNFATIYFRNSKTKKGAEVKISWLNRDLFNI